MKKLLTVVLCLLCLCGCEEQIKDYKKDGVIIEYSTGSNYGSEEDMKRRFVIRLRSNKIMEYGYEQDGLSTVKISDDEFNKIINYAFGEKFSELPSNISDDSILDGSSSYITVYYSDNTSKRTGGSNPTNEIYSKLIKILNDCKK